MAESEAHHTNSIALRPLASPRPTPPPSPDDIDFGSPIDERLDAESTPSSGTQSPVRGRTLHRIPHRSRLVSRATTRRYTNLDSTHIEWEERLAIHGLTNTTSELDHSLLEPLPSDRFRTSLSEELHRAATFDRSIDLTNFGGHRDTFGLLQLRNLRNPITNLPFMFFEQISQYLDSETYKSVRLTCHSWSVAISKARPVRAPAVAMLPAEILEQIYMALSPINFNAARHTCRAWMRTSLEPGLSMLMLKRGGWFGTVAADLKVATSQELNRTFSIGNDEWFLSKRLATECSLSNGWSGHGIHKAQATTTGLRLTSQIDFSQLGIDASQQYTNDDPHAKICFTVSTCTNFLLACKSHVIYIHALRRMPHDGCAQPYGGRVEFVTSIICPDHVLAVSMDTSCQRYAVAALLRGAVGIVHDLDLVRYSSPWKEMDISGNRIGTFDRRHGSVFIPPLSRNRSHHPSPLYTQATFGTVYTAPRIQDDSINATEDTFGNIHSETLRSRTYAFGDGLYPPQPVETAFHAYAPHVDGGPFSVYPNLCQIDDPPRSVAICPQRRCVAFGCQRGIQLHWMDALTGQNLNRWFPLSAPADHLFFMPRREDVDSSRKLRLISSAAASDLVIDVSHNQLNTHHRFNSQGNREADQDNFTETIFGPPDSPGYYKAVPLSDGYHLLLTLPETGELCLVKDKPGSLEAEKLVRKFTFIGPKTDGGITIKPHAYTAATELQWGIRVAAAYEDRLWLFVVPPDLFFERMKSSRKLNTSDFEETNGLSTVRITGVEIASFADPTCLTLDGSAGDLTLWVSSSDATTSIFQLAGNGDRVATQRVALNDGTIVLTRDADGDSVMTDLPDPRDTQSDIVMTDTSDVRDADGDVLMADSPSPEEQALQSDGTASFTQDWPSSCVPCFPSCNHKYCIYLLLMDNGMFVQNKKSLNPSRASSHPQAGSNVSISSHSSRVPLYPAIPPSYIPPQEDEGYISEGDEGLEGSRFAIYIPPMSSRWNQDEDAEWVPEYLQECGTGIEDEALGLDVVELCRCQCDIVSL